MAEELAEKTNPEYTTFTPDGQVIEEVIGKEIEDQNELGEELEEESLENQKARLAEEIRTNQEKLHEALDLLNEHNERKIEELKEDKEEYVQDVPSDREVLENAIEENKDDNWIAARASQIRKNIERDEH